MFKDIKKDDYSITNIEVIENNKYISCNIELPSIKLESLFRITDKENGEDLTLVSIDYGMNYEVIAQEWDNIEALIKEIAIKHLLNIYYIKQIM